MRYILKQKLFSWGDDFFIKDENEQDVYFVDGKAFAIGDQLWGKTYEISRGGEVVAVVKKALFAPFHHRFTVDVPGPDDLEAEGNFTDHEYTFRRGDRTVATVSKRWFAWTDTYGVDIAPGEDEVLILASAVVVDQACHPDDGKRH
jgi:uncharacterized protein YxjI